MKSTKFNITLKTLERIKKCFTDKPMEIYSVHHIMSMTNLHRYSVQAAIEYLLEQNMIIDIKVNDGSRRYYCLNPSKR